MSEIKLTKEQQSAVYSRGGNILVSAAAGSGKTAVLTQRVVERLIFDKDPISADRLMIVTFTRASAAEMKARIMQKLSELSSKDTENAFLRRQINLFERAKIGTIHSVCVELLKENFSILDLPSDFRLGENDEIKNIEVSSVNKILEERFQKGTETFFNLSELFGGKKGTKTFCDAVLKILNFARSVPFYREWLHAMPSKYDMPSEKGTSLWEDIIFENAKREYLTSMSFFRKALDECSFSEDFKGYEETITEDVEKLSPLGSFILNKDLTSSLNFLNNFKFGSLKAARKASPDEREYIKNIRELGKESIQNIKEKFILSSYEDFLSDLSYFKPVVTELFEIAEEADDLIFSSKMKEKVIDFSDLEQLSLKLLLKKEKDGSYVKTEAAEKLSSQIDEIMIDEYQDVNEVQDAILKALSKGNNRFMVGDVKQSIYRFRQACPALFMNMLSCYHSDDEGIYPKKILLNGNFRTRKEIASFINRIFNNIMTGEMFEINYSDGHSLIPMAESKSNIENPVEIKFAVKTSGYSADEAEAKVAAKKIKELLSSDFTIRENDTERPLRPSDIAILMRNPKNKAKVYQNALQQEGIQASTLKDDDFFNSFEIKPVINLLKAICNPSLSMELSGAMLSPVFGFTDEALAALKLSFPAKNLYTTLSKCEENSPAGNFKKYFDSLIIFSKTNTPASLISKIFYDTGYKTLISAMENGVQMEERLNMLLIYADGLRSRGAESLNLFLKALDAAKENSVSIGGKSVSTDENSVTITSIHSSKGLEWPVVILSETSSQFSFYQNDMVENYILDKDLGFASIRRDEKLKIQFPTIPLASSRCLTRNLSTAEEMRLLYVALTRAKEKLIITAAVSDADKKISSCLIPDDDFIYPYIVYSKKSYIDWILLGFKAESPEEITSSADVLLTSSAPFEEEDKEEKEEKEKKAEADENIKSDILKRLAFNYPFKESTTIPSKIAASQLSGNLRSAYAFSKKPVFAKGGKEGSKRGSAFHKFMQLCSFKNASCDAFKESQNLLALNLMTEDEVSLLSFEKIEKLLRGKIGDLIFSSDKILREYRFFAPASVSSISENLCDKKGSSTMLEGVADLITIKEGKINIIDYKTDRVTGEEELRELYKNQVLLYKDMLSYTFSLPVDKIYLYSFHLGKEILI